MIWFLSLGCLFSQADYEALLLQAKDEDGDGYLSIEYGGADCADQAPDRYPGAPESCNGLDDDCDGEVDEQSVDATIWYMDLDADGVGAEQVEGVCDAPSQAVAVGGDCDDSNPAISPVSPEICDGLDNTCNGLVDDLDPAVEMSSQVLWFPDADLDGFGDSASAGELACEAPDGKVENDGDCDDADPYLNPEAAEICSDGLDNDCSGDAPECIFRGDFYLDEAEVSYEGSPALQFAVLDSDADGEVELVVLDEGLYLYEAVGSNPSLSKESAAWSYPDDAFGYRQVAATPVDERGYQGLVQSSSNLGLEAFLGSAIGLEATPSVQVTSTSVNTEFGKTLYPISGELAAGSVFVTVGAPTTDGAGGFVYLWLSQPEDGSSETSADIVISSGVHADFGAVANGGLGDLDGDGLNELALGAGGDVRVFSGLTGGGQSVLVDDATTQFSDSERGEWLGDLAIGDLSGDGYADLLVSAPKLEADGSPGVVLLFEGQAELSSNYSLSDAAVAMAGGTGWDDLGRFVEVADVDGNGVDDLLLVSRESALLFYGPLGARTEPSQADAEIFGATGFSQLCFDQVALLDVNSDYAADLFATCSVVAPSVTQVLFGRGQ